MTGTAYERSGTADPAPRLLTHVPALDGVRGVAVLLVMATHAVLVFWPRRFDTVVPGGFLGVDLFFVLSGFLITSLLLGEQATTGRISLRGFYRRRALRLFPALAVLLAAHLLYTVVTGLPAGIELRSIGVIAVYVSNWYVVAGHLLAPGLQHMWSLSVEEQFYVLWPLVTMAVLGTRRSLRLTVRALLGAVVVVALWRAFLAHGHTVASAGRLGIRTDTRADGLLLGAVAGYLWARRSLPRRGLTAAAWISAAFLVACVILVSPKRPFYNDGGYTLVALAGATIVLAVAQGKWSGARALEWAPLRVVGRVSYGLYLWHLPTFFAVQRYTRDWAPAARLALALALTTLATAASWKLVEVPFLRRKYRTRVSAHGPGGIEAHDLDAARHG